MKMFTEKAPKEGTPLVRQMKFYPDVTLLKVKKIETVENL